MQPGSIWRRPLTGAFCLLLAAIAAAPAAESPTSYGEAARVDTPIVRIPMRATPPTIDGVMEQGEWEDAAAFSGFWYDYGNSDFRFMAPPQTQLQVYMAYDKEHLYVCYTSPVYPENSWLKARGRFPDVLSHPLYGMLWDDHLEFELRPYADIAQAFQLGLFRWDINPINAYCDWYWSINKGQDMRWKSGAVIRSVADGKRWVVEYAIPFAPMLYGNYEGNDRHGQPHVVLPPPDGTIYRTWFARAIGGNGPFFNAYDNHIWNTTKTQIILDSQAPAFQVNELGPIMEDIIDLTFTVKNHNTRSETVRLGFFVESAEGLIYSTYDAPDLNDGLLELRPGEVRQLRLKQPFPGISTDGNVLWFDVRSAGQPAKVLFRTRLIRFHSMDGGAIYKQVTTVADGAADATVVRNEISFKQRRIDVIEELRPPRKDFESIEQFSPYTKRLAVILDKGIHGASEEAKTAVEAKVTVLKNNVDEDEIAETRAAFLGNFACAIIDLPNLVEGESYRVSLLLFDENRRIVGERLGEPFTYRVAEWQGNSIGKQDAVWEPFTPIQVTDNGFETLKHRFVIAPSGLPAQLDIKPDPRELPLEKRADAASVSAAELLALGRGPQFRQPMRLEAVIDGQRVAAEVVTPAQRVRTGQSEVVYASKLRLGGIDITLTTQYDCDGAMHASLTYGAAQPVTVERFELVADAAGVVDLKGSSTGNASMAPADVWDCTLPTEEGVIWGSSETDMEMFYNRFMPWFWFGDADRGWSWFCDSDAGWQLDREGDAMLLERNAAGEVTWRVLFVNHASTVSEQRQIDFTILTHPTKPKPERFRQAAWHFYMGRAWADGYDQEPIVLPEDYLVKRWKTAAGAPRETPDSERTTFRKDEPPYHRYGQWRNVGVCAALDQIWEDKATYYFEQHIRIGRRVGWWMDEYFPVSFGRSNNLAMGNSRLRRPEEIQGDELPWHSGFLTGTMRNHYKRLARVFAENNVPQRQHTWSNNAARMLESTIWSSLLVEECGAGFRSYEIDVITQFPNSLYRCMAMNYTGLVTALCADSTPGGPGDDLRLDRQLLGRCLLNDIGFTPNGPHGTFPNKEQGVRLLTKLADFGFFEDQGIEKLPFWRNEAIVRLGDQPNAESQVYTTIYRRPLPDGSGYQAIFVILNESFDPVELPLIVADPARLGGKPSLTAGQALKDVAVPEGFAGWWKALAADGADRIVLRDFETGQLVARQGTDGQAEIFGPVSVPYHDYRILYATFSAEPAR